MPTDLERQVGAFVDHHHNLYHEGPFNLSPANVYQRRGAKTRRMREEIEKQTIRKRLVPSRCRLNSNKTDPDPLLRNDPHFLDNFLSQR